MKLVLLPPRVAPFVSLLFLSTPASSTSAFTAVPFHRQPATHASSSSTPSSSSPGGSQQQQRSVLLLAADTKWDGNVVSNTQDGKIRGCSMQQVSGSSTEWIITIDGVEADLARFSDAIYKKVVGDAKQQRFQGFRPGTIPPHLEPTYRAFAMDECARETVLEALQQNDVRPFEAARTEMKLENFCIPPPVTRKKEKKKKKKAADGEAASNDDGEAPQKWLAFETMKEAIDAGWKPGQSFSFVAKNVKGQKVKSKDSITDAKPLGLDL